MAGWILVLLKDKGSKGDPDARRGALHADHNPFCDCRNRIVVGTILVEGIYPGVRNSFLIDLSLVLERQDGKD